MNEWKGGDPTRIEEKARGNGDAQIGTGKEGSERRRYDKPALKRLGLLRERTARRASVTVTHDSSTGSDTFTF